MTLTSSATHGTGNDQSLKDKGLTFDKVSLADASHLIEGNGMNIYQQYQQRLTDLNACDFDLLLHNLTIFNGYPDILADYHQRITHVMVDEYQDTNGTISLPA